MKFTFVFLILITIILGGCSSSVEQPKQTIANKPQTQATEVRSQPTSQGYIKKALEQSPGQARSFYIQALRYAIKEQRDLEYIQAIVDKIDLSKYNSISQDIELVKSLLFIEEPELANKVIKRLQTGQLPKRYQVSLWIIKAQMESAQMQHVQAVQTVFRTLDLFATRLTQEETVLLHQVLWKHLLQVPTLSLDQFQSDFGGDNTGLLQLAKIIKVNLANPQLLVSELNRWQQLFPNTVNSQLLPTYINQLLQVEPYQPQHIALVLPFSGKLSEPAKHIRNGFLAAANFNQNIKLSFIDAGKYSTEEIDSKLLELNPDFIVGPLLKEKVAELQNTESFINTPSLLLNQPDDLPAIPNADHFFYGLSPEDEIEQAVEYFVENDIENPTVIYADNSLGRRLSQKFQELWSETNGTEAEAVAFKSKSKLGETVKELLDVTSSEGRIKDMKALLGNQLKTKTRSRVDIDAVYVIANSQQTRLIKPFFDVNVSEFGNRLPIYASSRSYVVNETTNQKRDLTGLAFTEMPWLIQSTNLKADQIYSEIGQNQTQLKKLFAFGYDAFQLVPALAQLRILPKQAISGLTGRLQLDQKNRVKRQLKWSQYARGKVEPL